MYSRNDWFTASTIDGGRKLTKVTPSDRIRPKATSDELQTHGVCFDPATGMWLGNLRELAVIA